MEPEGGHRNSVIKRRNPIEFGLVFNDTKEVHTRLTYLRHLIVSLAQAKDIERTLIIFSHDYYDEEINNLVRSIDFTKVMQIFYPYSIQTHPSEFPGVDPNDCPRDAKFEQAVKLKCNNAMHPDVHGHYREAKYTQTKHHWWWKANRIFNQLQCTASHTGKYTAMHETLPLRIACERRHAQVRRSPTIPPSPPRSYLTPLRRFRMVVFLEEDHYVAEDFIHMLNLLRSTADKSCPRCEILCLGTYLKTYQYHVNSDKRKKHLTLSYLQSVRAASEDKRRQQSWNFQVYPNLYGYTQKVEITPWHSSLHNMGMVFNRTVWSSIMRLQEQFCSYDDYNWDYSLLHLSQNRPGQEKFKVMLCKGPRVFHIGECGFHHKKSNCNASTVISKVQKLLLTAKKNLYPARLTATVTTGGVKQNKKLVKGNGGWGDLRSGRGWVTASTSPSIDQHLSEYYPRHLAVALIYTSDGKTATQPETVRSEYSVCVANDAAFLDDAAVAAGNSSRPIDTEGRNGR
ncbi:Alpha-1,6-mannosyl-glycoprotein 2-beta-N-acetylglucosaminyltransferase [Eumeta japonica]|uniref:Alpha-1,6-mannosyl-glycoprotein 2-beta-N-acetylglucosaminyltransferase n=1 Tax=Eumeta variegata TaxID=151549 RepID=A0A4C1VVC6_EUMVA|nr:Alpha-1,6-mannosyl-glycoprotein 2-beta-N-acetylglucosaminyltransferase [Eumeta japonica]